MIKTDFLVIGSGIAGLTFALKTARHFPEAKVIIITKADESESNTKYAQGGMAVALNAITDSFEKHISDTLIAGDGLCDKKVVDFVIKEGPERVKELIGWGANFDKQKSGEYDLGKEGGHTTHRIIHHADSTGLEIEKALLKKIAQTVNIEILSHHFVVDLITDHHLKKIAAANPGKISCYGAYILNPTTNSVEKVISKITLLATGGTGQVYRNTTNPVIATGDGIAMAHRAKAKIKNMEFIQFHPTALYHPGESPSFLISEAVRGFGAILRTQDGLEFMQKYDTRKELASRDIVARAIDYELKKRGDNFVYLDCRHIPKNKFFKHFPNIYNKCKSIGIDITKHMIPVVPAAHYLCGGIEVDAHGNTAIKNLYACGECSYTGLHGANRLASNSLLEALVFAHRCFEDAGKKVKQIHLLTSVPAWNAKGTVHPKEKIILTHNRKELQDTMSNFVGIVRSDERLEKAMERVKIITKETKQLYSKSVLSPQLCELRNMTDIASLIIKQSIKRKKNNGGFYNIDLIKKAGKASRSES